MKKSRDNTNYLPEILADIDDAEKTRSFWENRNWLTGRSAMKVDLETHNSIPTRRNVCKTYFFYGLLPKKKPRIDDRVFGNDAAQPSQLIQWVWK